ncbi:hypothetical protein BDZ97DRAFT_1039896 [Flammula alnicola]|nr:hypothetical protein BDZ97DRAFT_1039896 [Flammula alnicola]
MRSFNGHRQTRDFRLELSPTKILTGQSQGWLCMLVILEFWYASHNRCLPTPTPMDWIIILVSFAVRSLILGVLVFRMGIRPPLLPAPRQLWRARCISDDDVFFRLSATAVHPGTSSATASRSRTQIETRLLVPESYSCLTPPFLSYRGNIGIPDQPSSSQHHTHSVCMFRYTFASITSYSIPSYPSHTHYDPLGWIYFFRD